MKENIRFLLLLVAVTGLFLFNGCGTGDETPAPAADEAQQVSQASDEPVVEHVETGAELSVSQYEISSTGYEPGDYTDPSAEAGRITMDFASRLGIDVDGMQLIESNQVYQAKGFWLWRLAYDYYNAPMLTSFVRLDLRNIETFEIYAEFAPLATEPGNDYPDLAEDLLGLEDMGFERANWLSEEGMQVYKKYSIISDYGVATEAFVLRFDPVNGTFIGFNWYGYPPLTGFDMNYEINEAVEVIERDLGRTNLSPVHIDLVQLVDGDNWMENSNVYWEVTMEDGYVYVRCNDGNLAISPEGPDMPLGL